MPPVFARYHLVGAGAIVNNTISLPPFFNFVKSFIGFVWRLPVRLGEAGRPAGYVIR
jgi:hypothetical protein